MAPVIKRSMLNYNSYELLSQAAAHFFTTACKLSIAQHGKFIVALSGGNTPKRMYQLLAKAEFSANIDWKKIFIFFSDERYVPHSDKESNFKMASAALLDHIPIPRKNIFAIPVSSTPEKDAARYELDVKKATGAPDPVFDLVILGLGDDGHTASLFPGNKILGENKRLVKEVYHHGKGNRISFTLPLINRAKQILFLVSGPGKEAILKKILTPGKTKVPLPVQLIKGNILWMLNGAG